MVPGADGAVPAAARDLRLGDRLAMVELPRASAMWLHEDVAWLFGFFAAEGCITSGRIRIYNKDRKPLERCAEILLQHFGIGTYFVEGDDEVWRLTVRSPDEFAKWLRPQTYATDGNKRVPRSVLNAQTDAKLAFLRGYNEGDGLRAGHGAYEFKSFKTKSPILALGLCCLVAGTTGQRICMNTEVRDGRTYILISLNSNDPQHRRWGSHLELPEDVIKKIEPVPYEGEVWDFETEDHVFHAGLGRNLVHNTGPRRGGVFVESNFATQISEIEAGIREPVIFVGDLKPRRDYSDVRDIVRGYWALLERGEPGEVYNLCSGKSWPIQHVLDFLLGQSRVKGIAVKIDPARLRPSDVMELEGDPGKIERAVGWKVEIPFERTLTELLDYWRQRIPTAPR
jgi:hypothetical protein